MVADYEPDWDVPEPDWSLYEKREPDWDLNLKAMMTPSTQTKPRAIASTHEPNDLKLSIDDDKETMVEDLEEVGSKISSLPGTFFGYIANEFKALEDSINKHIDNMHIDMAARKAERRKQLMKNKAKKDKTRHAAMEARDDSESQRRNDDESVTDTYSLGQSTISTHAPAKPKQRNVERDIIDELHRRVQSKGSRPLEPVQKPVKDASSPSRGRKATTASNTRRTQKLRGLPKMLPKGMIQEKQPQEYHGIHQLRRNRDERSRSRQRSHSRARSKSRSRVDKALLSGNMYTGITRGHSMTRKRSKSGTRQRKSKQSPDQDSLETGSTQSTTINGQSQITKQSGSGRTLSLFRKISNRSKRDNISQEGLEMIPCVAADGREGILVVAADTYCEDRVRKDNLQMSRRKHKHSLSKLKDLQSRLKSTFSFNFRLPKKNNKNVSKTAPAKCNQKRRTKKTNLKSRTKVSKRVAREATSDEPDQMADTPLGSTPSLDIDDMVDAIAKFKMTAKRLGLRETDLLQALSMSET